MELMFVENGRPYYYATDNANAAISTATDLVRNTSPYNLNGEGYTVGIWDGGSVLSTHQEFNSNSVARVNVKDGASSHWHSTHVGGTIGAEGDVASALGMAPSVTIDSYDWNLDQVEVASRAASYPGEPGKIYVSNHSYGYITGWDGVEWWGVWIDNPNDREREDRDFGRYSSEAVEWDSIHYNAPYFLAFKSAGNDRNDTAPSEGTTFYYFKNGGWLSKVYDPATDPYSDGYDNGGYDTVGQQGAAKNLMCVGAVKDAVSSGSRDVSMATLTDFTGWGPADDGRVKPDIVANGDRLYSCYNSSDSAYATSSGTSMSSPNAAGSAILLQEYYGDLFPGQAMRSSTLKGLILHTADDLGSSGPDYQYGWGLMNAQTAADHIKDCSAGAVNKMMIEGSLTTADSSDAYFFEYGNSGAVRVTICWTDPPGLESLYLDDPTPKLVNDLDLRVVDPGGSTNMPYVLTPTNPVNPATTGDNTLDNVEQVYIASPVAGTYTVHITHKDSLTDDEQWYSLLISGGTDTVPQGDTTTTTTAVTTTTTTTTTALPQPKRIGTVVHGK